MAIFNCKQVCCRVNTKKEERNMKDNSSEFIIQMSEEFVEHIFPKYNIAISYLAVINSPCVRDILQKT